MLVTFVTKSFSTALLFAESNMFYLGKLVVFSCIVTLKFGRIITKECN